MSKEKKVREDGHYTIKRVAELPKKGNANLLYAIKGSRIEKFHKWSPKGKYEVLELGKTVADNNLKEVRLEGDQLVFDSEGEGFKESIDLSSLGGGGGAFSAIDEGKGIGWRPTSRDAETYGPIGGGSADLSFSSAPGTINGALGDASLAFGYDVIAGGFGSLVGGYGSKALAHYTVAFGQANIVSAQASFVTGQDNEITTEGIASAVFGRDNMLNTTYSFIGGQNNTINGANVDTGFSTTFGRNNSVTSAYSNAFGSSLHTNSTSVTVVGQANTEYSGNATGINTGEDPLFIVGNGTVAVNTQLAVARSDAFIVKHNGEITAPSTDNIDIDNAGGKAILTKEYAEENYARKDAITADTLNLTNLPVYADESAAITGGLEEGDVYRTSTGELRIKLVTPPPPTGR